MAMKLLYFGTCAYLFLPDEGSCYIFSSQNNCYKFLASYGVIIQSVIHSDNLIIQKKLKLYAKFNSLKTLNKMFFLFSENLANFHRNRIFKQFYLFFSCFLLFLIYLTNN